VFEESIQRLAAEEKEVEFTTFGRKTGKPSRKIIWITNREGRLYIRSGLGLTRDWPQNLLANGRGILHVAGHDVPVKARHVTDPVEARAMHAPVKQKYNAERPSSTGNEPLTPSEQAVFELVPDGA
jgi:deazaflavin-dependent oxidoreductase (nitroreductase family)